MMKSAGQQPGRGAVSSPSAGCDAHLTAAHEGRPGTGERSNPSRERTAGTTREPSPAAAAGPMPDFTPHEYPSHNNSSEPGRENACAGGGTSFRPGWRGDGKVF